MTNSENEWQILSRGGQVRIVDANSDSMKVALVDCSSEKDFGEAMKVVDQKIVMQEIEAEFEAEQKKVFGKMMISGTLAVVGTMATCALREAAVPTLFYYAELVRNCIKYDNLGEEKELALSIAGLEKPVMSGEGEMKVRKQLGIK